MRELTSLTNAKLEVESVRGAASAMQADLAAKQKFLEHLQLGAEEGARYRQALEESLQRRASFAIWDSPCLAP